MTPKKVSKGKSAKGQRMITTVNPITPGEVALTIVTRILDHDHPMAVKNPPMIAKRTVKAETMKIAPPLPQTAVSNLLDTRGPEGKIATLMVMPTS